MDRVALVTGGSRGIGAATAKLLAQGGWTVVVNCRSQIETAQALAEEIRASGGKAAAMQADVADEAQVLRMFERIDAEFGRIGALVNNAGVVDRPARVEDMSVARLQRMFAINVTGSFICAREAVRRMSTRHGGPGGAIVNVSSVAARLTSPNQYVDYAAAKAAVDVMTRGLALEVADEGIRVNAVRPGIIDTEIHASGGLPDRARELSSQIPVKRPGTALEVARTIVWLLSDEASYVTGSLLDVTGGR